MTESQDQNEWRKKKTDESPSHRCRLKQEAIPTIFSELPHYFTKPTPAERSEASTSKSRLEKESEALQGKIERFLSSDQISCLEDVQKLCEKEVLPKGIFRLKDEEKIVFLFLEDSSRYSPPKIAFSLTIYADLTFVGAVKNDPVQLSSLQHLLDVAKFRKFSEVQNVLAFLKSVFEEKRVSKESPSLKIVIESFISTMQTFDVDDENLGKKITFLCEQFALSLKEPKQRRYSSDLLASASLWKATSPALYRLLNSEGLLSLPSVPYLQKIMRALSVDEGLSDTSLAYLRARLSRLTDREKICALLIDEVFVSQKIEYCRGKFFGREEDGRVAKTLLSFMVKSIAGAYHDIVAMFPVNNLDSSKLKSEFLKVMEALSTIGFEVLVISLDNATANRKFFEDLGEGRLIPCIEHPNLPGRPLYLLFDCTHIYKNLYNNFQMKKEFDFPAFHPDYVWEFHAKFKHIEELYKHEQGRPVKLAYKLNDKVINPSSIEKTNVQLAESVFHEKTIEALKYYAQELDKPEWRDTAFWLKLMRKWWNIVNCKNPFLGIRMRDDSRKPVSKTYQENVEFLQEFLLWTKRWEENGSGKRSKRKCLTRETMLATRQSTLTLIEIQKYLIQKRNFEFVLFGQLQTDPLEKRFGHYRQLAGGNFFVSVRQVFESEKVLRIKSLLKFSEFSKRDIDDIFKPVIGNEDEVIEAADSLISLLGIPDISTSMAREKQSDQCALYFVAGYFARSVVKRKKCEGCKELLISDGEKEEPKFDSDDEDEEDEEVQENKQAFLHQINRGGLTSPSNMVFVASVCIWEFFSNLSKDQCAKSFLLSCKNPQATFAKALEKILPEKEETSAILESSCSNGHKFGPLFDELARRYFNIFAKNIVSEENSDIHKGKKRPKKEEKDSETARKVKKLQSN